MMKYRMTFENNMPMKTSRRVRAISPRVAPLRCHRRRRPMVICSSTCNLRLHFSIADELALASRVTEDERAQATLTREEA